MIIHNKIQSISSEEINEESDNLEKNDSLTLINYIKNSIDVFVQILVEQKVQEYKETKKNSQEEYETLLIKLESDIRSHISTEHVLKLEAENMQYEIEDLERENQKMVELLRKYDSEGINAKDNEIEKLSNELDNMKQLLKSYEEQNLKLSHIEKKLKTQIIKINQESQTNEKKYIEQINQLNNKIASLEEKLKSYSISSFSNTKNTNTPSGINSQDEPFSKTQYQLRKKSIQGSKSTSSLNNIEKYLQHKIHTKSIINSNTNHEGSSSKNISRDKSFNNRPNESNSYIAHNDSMLISKKHEEYLAKQDFCKKITQEAKKQAARNKKKGHNRQRSLEEVARFLRNKNSSLIKEMLFNSNNTHNSKTKKKGDTGSNKKTHFELVNNINIYTNTLKQDNHNVYVKASSIGSSNSSNNNNNTSDKHSGNTNVYGGNFNVVKVTKNKIRSISSKK